MKTKKLTFIRLALTVGAFITLCSFADECYKAWISDLDTALAEYHEDVINCLAKPVFGIPATSLLCFWEADVNYGNAVETAAADYEECIRR